MVLVKQAHERRGSLISSARKRWILLAVVHREPVSYD